MININRRAATLEMRHSMAQRHICLGSKVMASKATAGPCFNKLFAVRRRACLEAGSPHLSGTFLPSCMLMGASLNQSYKRSMQYCMNMVWRERTMQLYLGKPLAGATSLRVVLLNSLKHMISQRFLTPAGSGFRKAQPDWNLLSRVGLDPRFVATSAKGRLECHPAS